MSVKAEISERCKEFIICLSPGAIQIRCRRFENAGHKYSAWLKISPDDVGAQLDRTKLEDLVLQNRATSPWHGTHVYSPIKVETGSCSDTSESVNQEVLHEVYAHNTNAQQRIIFGESKWYQESIYTDDWINRKLLLSLRLNICGYLVMSKSFPIRTENSFRTITVSSSELGNQIATSSMETWQVPLDLSDMPSNIKYIESLTLVDPTTGKPDLEKTASWHAEDLIRIQKLKALIGHQSIGCSYYIEEINDCTSIEISEGEHDGYCYSKDPNLGITEFDNNNFPSELEAIADMNTRFVLADCPDITISQARWVRVKTQWQKPLFDSNDGRFSDYGPELHHYQWALRIAVCLNDKIWNTSDIHVYVSFKPETFPQEPWRLVKSTKCQRQNRWSKHDDSVGGFFYQVEPNTTWSIIDWCINSLSQLTDQHPASRAPIFNGNLYTQNREDRFKGRLLATMQNMKAIIEDI